MVFLRMPYQSGERFDKLARYFSEIAREMLKLA
jgi:hypothetical protein